MVNIVQQYCLQKCFIPLRVIPNNPYERGDFEYISAVQILHLTLFLYETTMPLFCSTTCRELNQFKMSDSEKMAAFISMVDWLVQEAG